MRKLIITVLFLFAFSGIGFASPQMDYSEGKASFDCTFRPNLDMNGQGNIYYNINPPLTAPATSGVIGVSRDFDGKANMDAGVTIGIGNNWAVQYRQYNPQGTVWNHSFISGSNRVAVNLDGRIRSEEFNILYKISPNASAFVGAVRSSAGLKAGASGNISGWTGAVDIPELRSEDKNALQVGLLGTAPIAKSLSAYGIFSYSKDYRNWEAGLAYDITKNLQLDVNYRNTKFDKFNYASATLAAPGFAGSSASVNLENIEVKGWGFGLTYKF